jgi:hypothetical protein
MGVIEAIITDVKIIEPTVFGVERGFLSKKIAIYLIPSADYPTPAKRLVFSLM